MGRVPYPGASSTSVVAATAHQVLLGSGYPTFLLLLPQNLPSASFPPGRPGPPWLGVPSSADSEAPAGPCSSAFCCLPSLCRAAFSTEHPDQLPEVASGHAEDPEVPWESRGGQPRLVRD